jgi:hypothetical protein
MDERKRAAQLALELNLEILLWQRVSRHMAESLRKTCAEDRERMRVPPPSS